MLRSILDDPRQAGTASCCGFRASFFDVYAHMMYIRPCMWYFSGI